jgi:hypothetical protein
MPIHTTMQKAGDNAVESTLAMSVSKCANALNIKISKEQIDLLVEDLIDVYKWDAMQDIMLALKKGRQGLFGTTYNHLNMIIVREWMSKVLEEKYKKIEDQHNNKKKQLQEELPNVDYQAYIEREKAKKEQAKEPSLSQLQYESKRFDYFNDKNNTQ